MSDLEPIPTQENHKITAEVMTPVIVNLGKKKKKTIKRLKRGKGPAMDEVLDVIEQVQVTLGAQADGKLILPVVVIYRQKTRNRLRPWF
ncbi:MAG: hypothetical protein Fur0022_21270 [Anaerolineales bacterium]